MVTDLQENVVVNDDDTITGTLKYVDDYTGFGDPTEGNFLAIHAEADSADTISVKVVPTTMGLDWQELDSDGILIAHISSTDQQIGIKAVLGERTEERWYHLGGLTLAHSAR